MKITHFLKLTCAIATAATLLLGAPAQAQTSLVLIPIGGNFTTDPADAAFAMHDGSNPLTKGTFAEFNEAMKSSATRVVPITEGQAVEF